MDLLGSGRTRVTFVSELPAEDSPPLDELELVMDESAPADWNSVLPPKRQIFKVATWPTGQTHVEELSGDELAAAREIFDRHDGA